MVENYVDEEKVLNNLKKGSPILVGYCIGFVVGAMALSFICNIHTLNSTQIILFGLFLGVSLLGCTITVGIYTALRNKKK